MARRGDGAADFVCREPGGSLWRRGQQPVAVQRLRRGQHGIVRRRRHTGRQGDQPPQHVNEQARHRRIRPVGIRRDVEQHDATGAMGRLGHQRRAVGKRRPGVGRQLSRGLGQHLSGHLHLVRDRQSAEW